MENQPNSNGNSNDNTTNLSNTNIDKRYNNQYNSRYNNRGNVRVNTHYNNEKKQQYSEEERSNYKDALLCAQKTALKELVYPKDYILDILNDAHYLINDRTSQPQRYLFKSFLNVRFANFTIDENNDVINVDDKYTFSRYRFYKNKYFQSNLCNEYEKMGICVYISTRFNKVLRKQEFALKFRVN